MMKQLLSLSLIFFVSLLAACSNGPTSRPVSHVSSIPVAGTHTNTPVNNHNAIRSANQLLRVGKKKEAANIYFNTSRKYPSPAKERLILQAAEIQMSLRNRKQVINYLKLVRGKRLTIENKARYAYIESLLLLSAKNINKALQILPKDTRQLPYGLSYKITQLRQRILMTKKGYPYKRGSIVLHSPAKTPTQNSPAPHFRLAHNVQKIAVLLPLTGSLAPIGKNILEGIRISHLSFAKTLKVKAYDTGKIDAVSQYNKATREGADLIIGPFRKQSIGKLAQEGNRLTRPVLGLNSPVAGIKLPLSLYQFGLFPEDEVIQIANFALSRNQRRAILFVPDSRWGTRLSRAFINAYKKKGGHIVTIKKYPNRLTDYIPMVRKVLVRNMNKTDMVFLAASPSQARLIYPSIVLYNNRRIPVYATSHIFSGKPNAKKDSTLNGIIYTEIPSILDRQVIMNRKTIPRLYALGMDALLIAKNIKGIAKQPNYRLNGKTGSIYLDNTHKFHRRLTWATFKNGLPRPYGE